jgi:HAD superfamily hydrolase (TIGR01450 family)
MYRAFILDLDGTVYVDGKPIYDIIQQLNILSYEDAFILFLTNNTSLNKSSYVNKLKEMGLSFVSDDNIISPIDVFLSYSKLINLKTCYYILPESVIEYIVNNDGPKFNDVRPEIILVGFDKELTYSKLQKACELINGNIPYNITHIDDACPSLLGPIPDCGAIATLLSKTTEKSWYEHFGKPGRHMAQKIQSILNNKGIEKNETVLIGDRYYTDIKLGNILDIDTVHVNTGESNRVPDSDSIPKFEFENITEFIKWQYTVR